MRYSVTCSRRAFEATCDHEKLCCSLVGLNLLEEALQVTGLVVEELNLFLALLAFDFASRGVARLDSLDLALKFDNLV